MESKKAKESILNSFRENNHSHAFLVDTNNLELCLEDIKDIARIINCSNDGDIDCTCNTCNLVKNNNNPDVVVIQRLEKEDKEKDEVSDMVTTSIQNKKLETLKGEITKKQIERLMEMFRTSPLVSKYQIYIIFEADKLNSNSANKILKFLEEPSETIIGFFITDNIEKMISTILSRCEIYKFRYGANNILSLLDVNEKQFDKYFDTTMELLHNLEHTNGYELILNSKNYSKKERDDIISIIELVKKFYTIKFENIVYNYYSDLEFAQQVLEKVETNDIGLISNRILLLEEILNDLNRNSIRDMSINKLFIKWV